MRVPRPPENTDRNWRIFWSRLRGDSYAVIAEREGVSLTRSREIFARQRAKRAAMARSREIGYLRSVVPEVFWYGVV